MFKRNFNFFIISRVVFKVLCIFLFLFILSISFFWFTKSTKFYYKNVLNLNYTCERYCYSTNGHQQNIRLFSSKTNYAKIRQSDFERQVTLTNCKPTKIWALVRHGAVSFDKSHNNDNEMHLLKLLNSIRQHIIKSYKRHKKIGLLNRSCMLCDEDLEELKNWQLSKWYKNNFSKLAPQGKLDAVYLAKSYKNALPELFDDEYSSNTYHFRYSRENRTTQMYKKFVNQLFGRNADRKLNIKPMPKKYRILTPHFLCAEATKNTLDLSEIDKYQDTEMVKHLIVNIINRLHLYDDNHIENMWKMCRYEQSWTDGNFSPWCSVFSPMEMKMFDYAEDLSFYHMKSYGRSINENLACETVNDMLTYLDPLAKSSQKVSISFVHSTLIYLFLTALGLFRDSEHLRYYNFDRMQNRLFKSSEMMPFSANFAAIHYECDDSERNKIMFIYNQKPIELLECKNHQGICNWNELENLRDKFLLNKCKERFCK